MNVLIDTNVLLDDILGREPFVEEARKVSQLVADNIVGGYLTANCLTDIFYIVSKKIDEEMARKAIRNLLLVFSVVSIDGDDCLNALDLAMGDFEDALVVICAKKAGLDYIITNDKKFLGSGYLGTPAINPNGFLLKILEY